eukprot:COSAG06_NODE_57198_length_281_cov_0.851648_1_plen_61_part_01
MASGPPTLSRLLLVSTCRKGGFLKRCEYRVFQGFSLQKAMLSWVVCAALAALDCSCTVQKL